MSDSSEEQNSGLTPYRWIEYGKEYKWGSKNYCVFVFEGFTIKASIYHEYDCYWVETDSTEVYWGEKLLSEVLALDNLISWAYCEIEEPEY